MNNIIETISNEAEDLVNESASSNYHKLTFTCPFCKDNLWSTRDVTGMMVWCGNAKCASAETPFGHALSDNRSSDSKLEQYAYEILMAKAKTSMGKE